MASHSTVSPGFASRLKMPTIAHAGAGRHKDCSWTERARRPNQAEAASRSAGGRNPGNAAATRGPRRHLAYLPHARDESRILRPGAGIMAKSARERPGAGSPRTIAARRTKVPRPTTDSANPRLLASS
jgi:hypothetical protein